MKKGLLIIFIVLYIIAIVTLVVSMKQGQVIPNSYSAAKEDSLLSVFASLSAMIIVFLIAIYGLNDNIKK